MATTVDSGAIVGGGSGLTGWSARSTFLIEDVGDYFQGAPNASIGYEKLAQSFAATSSYSVSAVVLNLTKAGTPSDNWTVTIEGNSGSNTPNGTPIATSGIFAVSTDLAGANKNVVFTFASPPSLSNGTTYWIVLNRSGAHDGSNQARWALNDSGVSGMSYAGGRVATYSASVWTVEPVQYDFPFITLKTTKSLYQVTQDANLHMWRSTDNGSSWTELNNAGAPTVNSSTKPFSAAHRWDARGISPADNARIQGIWTGYFSNTNTGRVRRFDLCTGLWDTTDIGGADFSNDVDFNRNIRVSVVSYHLHFWYTSLADDADLEFVMYDGSMSAQQVLAGITSTESGIISDVVTDRTTVSSVTLWHHAFHYDVTADDYQVRSTNNTTQGTALDIDAAAADVETEHHSAVYQTYSGAGGVDTVVAAYIAGDGSLEERTAQLEVTSASITLGTQHAVGTSTSYLGRSLTTCKYDGDLFIFAGTGSGIDVYKDDGATGTWGSVENWLTGLSSAVLSTAVPITGVGILVSYVDGGNVKVDLYAPSAVVPKSDSDSLDLTLTESESLLGKPADTESLATTLTEVDTVAATIPETEPLAVTLTENNGVVTAAINDSESLAVAISESEVVTHFYQKADSDSLAVTITENNGVVAASIPDTEALATTISETDVVAAQIVDTEALDVTLVESSDVTGDIVPITDSDSLAVTAVETDTVAASIADTESLSVTASEADTIAVTLSETESLATTISEVDTVAAAIPESDSLAVTISESESVAKSTAKSDSDSLAVTIVESNGVVSAAIADTESIVTLVETDVVTVPIAESDVIDITLTDVGVISGLFVPKLDSDDLDITLVDESSVYVVPRGTLDAYLQIEQTMTGKVSAGSPMFGHVMIDKVAEESHLYGELVVT